MRRRCWPMPAIRPRSSTRKRGALRCRAAGAHRRVRAGHAGRHHRAELPVLALRPARIAGAAGGAGGPLRSGGDDGGGRPPWLDHPARRAAQARRRCGRAGRVRGGAGPARHYAAQRLGRHRRAVPPRRRRDRRPGRPASRRSRPPAGAALAAIGLAAARPSPSPLRCGAGGAGGGDGGLARLPLSVHVLRQGEFPRPLSPPAARNHSRRARRADRGRGRLRLFHRRDLPAVARAARSGGPASGRLRNPDPHRSVAGGHARSARRRRLRVDRGRRREPDRGGPPMARQGLPPVDRRAEPPAGSRQALGGLRAGQSDRERGGRPRRSRALAHSTARRGRVGERAGAAVSLSRFAGLPAAVGIARRSRLGARGRLLPRSPRGRSATSRKRCRAGSRNWRRRPSDAPPF